MLNILCVIVMVFTVFGWHNIITASEVRTIHVIDDTREGVKSEMLRIGRRKEEEDIGITDDGGYYDLVDTCVRGEKIRAVPVKRLIYYSAEKRCPRIPKEIVVTKKKYISNLQMNALWLDQNNQFGKAALVYNELRSRAVFFNKELAKSATDEMFAAFGEHVNVENAFVYDPDQGKNVMSPALKINLKSFQKENGLRVTGRLDYKTLEKAAGSPIAVFLFRRVEGTDIWRELEGQK